VKHYPHHIGDFDRNTRHLTRIERSIYRDLMDMYYDTEEQIPLDLSYVCRKIVARTNEESTAVEQVLNEFFTKTATGWYHARCEEEISKYHANNSQRAQAGKASAAAKAQKKQQALNTRSTDVETPFNGTSTNQSTNQPINQEPKKKSASAPAIQRPDDVDEQTWSDWIQLRKAKRATVSLTVITEARGEAEKAGLSLDRFLSVWCARGSQGLMADWLKPNERGLNGAPLNKQEALEARNRAIAQRWADGEAMAGSI